MQIRCLLEGVTPEQMLQTWHDMLPAYMQRWGLDRGEVRPGGCRQRVLCLGRLAMLFGLRRHVAHFLPGHLHVPPLAKLAVCRASTQLVELFGSTRDEWMAADMEGWLAPNRIYPGVAEAMQALMQQHEVYIVTTKQVGAGGYGSLKGPSRGRRRCKQVSSTSSHMASGGMNFPQKCHPHCTPALTHDHTGALHGGDPAPDGGHPLPHGPHLFADRQRAAQERGAGRLAAAAGCKPRPCYRACKGLLPRVGHPARFPQGSNIGMPPAHLPRCWRCWRGGTPRRAASTLWRTS